MSFGDPTLPDAGGGMCCDGAANMGPGRCTCWDPVYDQEQAEPQQGPMAVRPTMCADCAFRPGSPERTGDPRFQHSDEGDIEELVGTGAVFACHQGMRRRLARVHPTGARVESGPGDYEPPQRGEHAWKADGTPADVCAGLTAARRQLFKEEV